MRSSGCLCRKGQNKTGRRHIKDVCSDAGESLKLSRRQLGRNEICPEGRGVGRLEEAERSKDKMKGQKER